MRSVRSAEARWSSRAESSEGFWPAPTIRHVNSLDPWIRGFGAHRRVVKGCWWKERLIKAERSTAVPITRIAPTHYGINPFRKNALSAISLSWLKSTGRVASPSDAPRRIVATALQNNGGSLKPLKERKIPRPTIRVPNLLIKPLTERRTFFSIPFFVIWMRYRQKIVKRSLMSKVWNPGV